MALKKIKSTFKKNSNKYKIWAILIILSLIFIFFIPLIINGLYQIPAPFPILHLGDSVAVVLGLYGNILSSVLGIVGVFISIQYARKQSLIEYQRNSRNSVLPCISLYSIKSYFKYPLYGIPILDSDNNDSNNSIIHKEEPINEVIFILKNDHIIWKPELLDDEKELYVFGHEKTKNGVNIIDSLNIPLMISNVGNASIPFLNISLSDLNSNVKCQAPPLPLFKDSSIKIRICSVPTVSKTYNLHFVYQDILQNKYEDLYSIKIDCNANSTSTTFNSILFQHLI